MMKSQQDGVIQMIRCVSDKTEPLVSNKALHSNALQNVQQRKGHDQSRATNNDDISEGSRMTNINLLGNISNNATPVMGQENLNSASVAVDPCMPSNVVVQYNGSGEAMTPVMFRLQDSLLEQRKDGDVDLRGEKRESFNRQHTVEQNKSSKLPNGFNLSKTGTFSIGDTPATKHRGSITNASQEFTLLQAQPPMSTKIPYAPILLNMNQQQQPSGNTKGSLMSTNSPRRRSLKQSQSSQQSQLKLISQVPVSNEHIISIFDKDTEKSYLLEQQQVMQPKQHHFTRNITNVNEDQKQRTGHGSSIFKVQEVGTAKFKCLPVTDYGKIMNLHKQREQRKIQTADGTRRTRNRRVKTVAPTSTTTNVTNGMTSAETFHSTGKYRGKFAMVRTQQQVSKGGGGGGGGGGGQYQQYRLDSAGHTNNKDNKTFWLNQDKTAAISGVGSHNELRNSRSTVASNTRKEVFSKTNFLNEQGMHVTNMQTFKHSRVMSPVSSRASQDPYMKQPQYNTTSGGVTSTGRVPTADTNVARRIYIDKLKTGSPGSAFCCCPTDIQSSITLNGGAIQQSPSRCLQCETLTNSHEQTQVAIKPQEKKFMRKRAQSQGGSRPNKFSNNSSKNCGLLAGKIRQRNPDMYNKLQSIASGLQKKVAPMQTEQINQFKESILKDYLSLLTFQNTIQDDEQQKNQDLSARERASPEEQLFELLQYIKNNAERSKAEGATDQSNEALLQSQPELYYGPEMGVRPVRTNIIQSVRGMPSYFTGRVQKDPIKQKQFQIPLISDVASNLDQDQDGGVRATNFNKTFTFDSKQITKLQAAIKENQMQLYSARGVNLVTEPAVPTTREQKRQAAEMGHVHRNKTNMRTISADQRERMLFKVGLASETVLKREQRLSSRRAWANRKVSEHAATKLSNIAALMQENPPLSPLIKESDRSDFEMVHFGSRMQNDKDNKSMSPTDVEMTSNQGAVNRKSLLLQKRKDSIGTSHVYDGTMLDEENGYILLAPRTTTTYQTNLLTSLTQESVMNSDQLASLTMIGRNPAFSKDLTNVPVNGGNDLHHVIGNHNDNKLQQAAVAMQPSSELDSINPDNQKMVKTYEFHLPMHHIREEEQRPQHLDIHVKAQNNSRYNLSKQSTVFRITRKKTGPLNNGRNDISSQNLEVETVADQHASLRNLNFIGSGDGAAFRFNQSQTSIRKRGGGVAQSKRSNQLAQSLEAIANVEASIDATQSQGQRFPAGTATSQSINFQISPRQDKEDDSTGGAGNDIKDSGDKQYQKVISKVPTKKPLSHMANRAVYSSGGGREMDNRSPPMQAHRQPIKVNTKMPSAARNNSSNNSPLICLSQQEFQRAVEQNQEVTAAMEGDNRNMRVSDSQFNSKLILRNPAAVQRSKTNPAEGRKTPRSPNKSPRSPRKQDLKKESKEWRLNNSSKSPPTINHQYHLSPLQLEQTTLSDENIIERKAAERIEMQLDYAIKIGSHTDDGKVVPELAMMGSPVNLDKNDEEDNENQGSPAFLVLQTEEEGGTTEILQINRRNFQLFNKSQADKHLLTASSMSEQSNFQKCATTLAVNHDTPTMSGNLSLKFQDAENQIEVINISQAIQTQTDDQDCSPYFTQNSRLKKQKTPHISQLYVTTKTPGRDAENSTTSPTNKMPPRSPESRLRYVQELLSDRGTEKKSIPVTNFPTKQLSMGRNNQHSKSASMNQPSKRQLYKGFKQPGFKIAQMYLPANRDKPNTSSQLNGTQRFKTFKANNELYMRIDAFKSPNTADEVSLLNQNLAALQKMHAMGETKNETYKALLQTLKGSLLAEEKSKQKIDEKCTSQGTGQDGKDADCSPYNTIDISHKPECPLHELEEFEQSQEAASIAHYMNKVPVYGSVTNTRSSNTNLSGLSKYHNGSAAQHEQQSIPNAMQTQNVTTSVQQKSYLEDKEGIVTMNARASISDNTVTTQAHQRNAKYVQKSLDSMKETITKSNKSKSKDRVKKQIITQPILWTVVAKKKSIANKKEQFGVQSSQRVSPIIQNEPSGAIEVESSPHTVHLPPRQPAFKKGKQSTNNGQQTGQRGVTRLQSGDFSVQGKNPNNKQEAASSNGTFLSPQSVLRLNKNEDMESQNGRNLIQGEQLSKKHSLKIDTHGISEAYHLDNRNYNSRQVQQSRSLSQTPNRLSEQIIPQNKGGKLQSKQSSRRGTAVKIQNPLQNRRLSSNAPTNNSKVSSNPKFKLNDLVLQVYADKKHAHHTSSAVSGGVKGAKDNQDIPFALKTNQNQGIFKKKSTPVKNHHPGVQGPPEPKQFTSVLQKSKGKTNPEILKNILQSKQQQVVVPRMNTQYQQVTAATGLDRAINFINFDKQKQNFNDFQCSEDGYSPSQQQHSSSMRQSQILVDRIANSQYGSDNIVTLGKISEVTGAGVVVQNSTLQSLIMHSARSSNPMQQAEVMSIASDATVKNESGQERTFGAMITGTGCLGHTSYNEAAVIKYEAQKIENEFNYQQRIATAVQQQEQKYYQELLLSNTEQSPAAGACTQLTGEATPWIPTWAFPDLMKSPSNKYNQGENVQQQPQQKQASAKDLLKQPKSSITQYADEQKVKQNLIVPIMTTKAKCLSTHKVVNLTGLDSTADKNKMSKDSFLYQSTVRNDSCANVINPADYSSNNNDHTADKNKKSLGFNLLEVQQLVPEDKFELDSTPTRNITNQSNPESPITRPMSKF